MQDWKKFIFLYFLSPHTHTHTHTHITYSFYMNMYGQIFQYQLAKYYKNNLFSNFNTLEQVRI